MKKRFIIFPLALTALFLFVSLIVSPALLKAQNPIPVTSVQQPPGCDNWDITKITTSISFNFDSSLVFVDGVWTLTPSKNGISEVRLDAKGKYIFYEVSVRNQWLSYSFDGVQIKIEFLKKYNIGDTINLILSYQAHPQPSQPGGEDGGMYFVKNINGDIQIWTANEPEAMSRYLLCHEHSNCLDKITTEFNITVPAEYVTLSNGSQVSSIKNINGTRTDKWSMNMEIPPYSVMLSVGKFAIKEDYWNGVRLGYYTDPKYTNYAENILPDLKGMLDLFSSKFNFTYPWPEYNGVFVEGFMGGALETTGAVTYNNSLEGTKEELYNNPNNGRILAHELVHQWFGNYVTLDKWSELVFNEGLANCGVYIFYENTDKHLMHSVKRQAKIRIFSDPNAGNPIVKVGTVLDPEAIMSDVRAYDRGAEVFWMLKQKLGDIVFFSGLHNLLVNYQHNYASLEDIQHEMEKVSGENLELFFKQWFFGKGFPKLKTSWEVKGDSLYLTVEQQQVLKGWDLYVLDIPVLLYTKDGGVVNQKIHTDKPIQTFTFRIGKGGFRYPVLDPNRDLLAQWQFDSYSLSDYEDIALNGQYFMPKYEAGDTLLKYSSKYPNFESICQKMARDTQDLRFVLKAAQATRDTSLLLTLLPYESGRYSYLVRQESLKRINSEPKYLPLFLSVWKNDQALEVKGVALTKINDVSPATADSLAILEWEKIARGNQLHQRFIAAPIGYSLIGTDQASAYFWSAVHDGNFWVRREIFKPLQTWINTLGDDREKQLAIFKILPGFEGLK